jgi:RimJ/RimL family protein N-acetyltransferase
VRFPDDVPVLTDGTVTLRAHRPNDADAVYEQCQDPLIQRFTTIPVPYTRQDADVFLASRAACWEGGTAWPFAVEAPDDAGQGRFAGSIGISLRATGIGEIGFGTAPHARGRGVTTAAVRLLVDWAFATQGLHTISWRCIAGNMASWRVAWRNGFHFEGTSRATLPRRGDALDAWEATLLATDDRRPANVWLAQPILSDGHAVLRPMKPADEKRFLETVLDPESERWLSDIPFPRTPEAFHLHVRDAALWPALGRGVFYALADAGSDRYVGGFAMFGFGGLEHNSAEVGYRIHPDARGRGYATSALRLAIRQAFSSQEKGGYGLDRLSLDAGDGNTASQRLARTCGFTETGRDRRCYRLSDDTVVDQVRFDLLADEWRGSAGAR